MRIKIEDGDIKEVEGNPNEIKDWLMDLDDMEIHEDTYREDLKDVLVEIQNLIEIYQSDIDDESYKEYTKKEIFKSVICDLKELVRDYTEGEWNE